jgi:hypothetical protein
VQGLTGWISRPGRVRGRPLEDLIRQYGADHVLPGTGYSYDMGESDPVGHESVPGLSAAAGRAIYRDNAARLVTLDGCAGRANNGGRAAVA